MVVGTSFHCTGSSAVLSALQMKQNLVTWRQTQLANSLLVADCVLQLGYWNTLSDLLLRLHRSVAQFTSKDMQPP